MTNSKYVDLGDLFMTTLIHEYMSANLVFYRFVHTCIVRHSRGDWGECRYHDSECNDYHLDRGGRLISSYTLPSSVSISGESRIWLITDADRSVTTVLFPSEY